MCGCRIEIIKYCIYGKEMKTKKLLTSLNGHSLHSDCLQLPQPLTGLALVANPLRDSPGDKLLTSDAHVDAQSGWQPDHIYVTYAKNHSARSHPICPNWTILPASTKDLLNCNPSANSSE